MDIESENKNTNEETKKKQEKQIFQILKELQSLINKESSIHDLCIINLK